MTQTAVSSASFVPIYHWRGGRPQIVDLEPDQTGWLVCLCLQREGDLSLLPLAWQVQAPDEHHLLIPEEQPYPTIYTKALDDTAVSLTLQQLQQDGWHIQGQLTLAFTGRDAIANFEQTYRQYLWQQPTATDQNS
ncbi:MAG: hypothetical protein H6656_19110 [Ardenticatenaceae bacterium]|nr:hypothetical protein [Ardenticatenaceae bacterium]